MPKGDRESFKADCEDGFTRIANLILEALSMVKLNGTQTGICLFLLRRTYGWNRSEDAISREDFAAACGTSKTYISRQLSELLNKNIIRRLSYEPGKTSVYAFNSNIADWDKASINLQALSANAQQGLYECASEGWYDQPKEAGYGVSDQTRYGVSDQIRYGVSNQTPPNQPQTTTAPMIAPALKTVIKTIKEKEIYSPDTLQYQLSELLLLKILEHLPGYKKPDLQKWAKSMDSLLRLDQRPPEEVKAVIIFAQSDSFWRSIILSVDNLRKQYDRLNMQRFQPRAGPAPIETRGKRGAEANDADEYKRFFQ